MKHLEWKIPALILLSVNLMAVVVTSAWHLAHAQEPTGVSDPDAVHSSGLNTDPGE